MAEQTSQLRQRMIDDMKLRNMQRILPLPVSNASYHSGRNPEAA